MQNIKIDRNAESIGVVHTHTHTHTHTSTFREIKRVANEATLYCVANRMTVALYEKKQCKRYILFFACKNFKNNERELKKNAKEKKYKNNINSDDIGVNMYINNIF